MTEGAQASTRTARLELMRAAVLELEPPSRQRVLEVLEARSLHRGLHDARFSRHPRHT
jgi:hypothetical protein